MSEEAVIRVVVQGAGGAQEQPRATHMYGSAGQISTSDKQRDANILAIAIAKEMRGLATLSAGLGQRRDDGVISSAAKGVLSLPLDLYKDFKNTIWKEFSKSFIQGFGGDVFGKQLGTQLSDLIRGAFTKKSGSVIGEEAADAVMGRVKGATSRVGSWFKGEGQAASGAPSAAQSVVSQEPPAATGAPQPVVEMGPTLAEKQDADRRRRERDRKREYRARKKWMAEEQRLIGDTSTPERAAEDEGLEAFAKGGKVGKTGLALVHVGETVIPAAESATGGPGDLTSDLDPITEALGLGKALKEVTDEVEEVVFLLKSKIGGNVPKLGGVYHKSVAIGPRGESPVLPNGDSNPSFDVFGTSPSSGGKLAREPQRKGVEASEEINVSAKDVRRAMREFNEGYNLLTNNCQHAADRVIRDAQAIGKGIGDLPEALPVDGGNDVEFKPNEWLRTSGLGKAYYGSKWARMSKKQRTAAMAAASQRGGRGAGRAAGKGGRLAARLAVRGAPTAGKLALKAGGGAFKFAQGFGQGVAEEAPGATAGAVAGGAALGAVGLAMTAAEKAKAAVLGTISTAMAIKGAVASSESDPGVQLANLGNMAKGAADSLGPLGSSVAYAAEFIKDFGGVMQNLTKTAERYGEYSASISAAQGQAEIVQTMGDLRRAQTIAPEMVKFLRAQSDLQQKFEDTKIRILVKLMPNIIHIVEILEKLMPAGENIADAIIAMLTPLNYISDAARKMIGIQEKAAMPEVEDPTDMLLNNWRMETEGTGQPNVDPGYVPRR